MVVMYFGWHNKCTKHHTSNGLLLLQSSSLPTRIPWHCIYKVCIIIIILWNITSSLSYPVCSELHTMGVFLKLLWDAEPIATVVEGDVEIFPWGTTVLRRPLNCIIIHQGELQQWKGGLWNKYYLKPLSPGVTANELWIQQTLKHALSRQWSTWDT